MKTRLFVAGVLALAVLGQSAIAGADPKSDTAITLTCGDEVVDVVVAGNGAWTPAHDLNSTLVGVPIAFGEFSGVFTSSTGEQFAFTDPPFAKRNVPRTRNLIVDCTFTLSGQFPDGSFTGNGSVTLMVPRIH